MTTKWGKYKKTLVTKFNNLILFEALDSRFPIDFFCRATNPTLRPVLAVFLTITPAVPSPSQASGAEG